MQRIDNKNKIELIYNGKKIFWNYKKFFTKKGGCLVNDFIYLSDKNL